MPKHISEWIDDAICAGKSKVFFGPQEEKRTERRTRERIAISICNSCPVITDCRLHARKNGELGVWGGETEEQRFAGGYIQDPWVARNARAREKRLLKKSESRHNNSSC
jgi:WhiB family redox-sensing transcriptional regulator